MKAPQNVLKMSTMSPDISRDGYATDWWLQQQSNGQAFSIWLTDSVSVPQDVTKSLPTKTRLLGWVYVHMLRWKCNCSCILSSLRDKSSKFYIFSSVQNKIMVKILCLCYLWTQCIQDCYHHHYHYYYANICMVHDFNNQSESSMLIWLISYSCLVWSNWRETPSATSFIAEHISSREVYATQTFNTALCRNSHTFNVVVVVINHCTIIIIKLSLLTVNHHHHNPNSSNDKQVRHSHWHI